MQDKPDDLNEIIKKEADAILRDKGLFVILEKYGIPHITGSYVLDLMSWRDLDIYIETNNLTEAGFFELGVEINQLFNPVKMNYRNEKITKTKGLPPGLYWGIYLGNERKDGWKIDCWAIDSIECRKRIAFCDTIADSLTPAFRKIILAIKSTCWQDPEYRRSYSSMDIYKAVLEKGITTLEEFRAYLQAAVL